MAYHESNDNQALSAQIGTSARSEVTIWGPLLGIIAAVAIFAWQVSDNPRFPVGEVAKAGLMSAAVGLAIARLSRHQVRPLAAFAIIAAVASLWFITLDLDSSDNPSGCEALGSLESNRWAGRGR